MIMAVVRIVPSKAFNSVRNVRRRFTAAMPMAAITPSAADSVAVAQPA